MLTFMLTLHWISMLQDIIQDYAKKTVTIDQHPHLSSAHGMYVSTTVPIRQLYYSHCFTYHIACYFCLVSVHPPMPTRPCHAAHHRVSEGMQQRPADGGSVSVFLLEVHPKRGSHHRVRLHYRGSGAWTMTPSDPLLWKGKHRIICKLMY